MSYSSWKAQSGLPDDTLGNANQALYFQKMTPTTTFAAGVAVFKGIAGLGLRASQLVGLAWEHREDGHCGAGAPRWNISVRDSAGNNYPVELLGCQVAIHREDGTGSGHTWCSDVQPATSISGAITSVTGVSDLGTLTVTGLAIVFDEGNEQPNPSALPDCPSEDPGPSGNVNLDNIEIAAKTSTSTSVYCWPAADDNGNANNGMYTVSNSPCRELTSNDICPPPCGAVAAPVVPTVSLPLGVAVDPTDTELVNALNLAYPGVALTDWLLYPYVVS
jgi:hypothetical protein